MAREGFGTDPTGMLARGAPGAGGRSNTGATVSVGRVGTPIQSAVMPGRSGGTGLGGRLNIPIGGAPAVKKKACGGKVKKMAKGGSVSSRADGCAKKGRTKGKMV